MSRRSLLAAALLAALPTSAASQPAMTGSWSGGVNVDGRTFPIAVAFGSHGTIDLTSAGALGVPLRDLRADTSHATFALPTHRGPIRFDLALDEGALTGAATFRGTDHPVRLERAGAPETPYAIVPVRLDRNDVVLGGSLFLPPDRGPHPAVVLLHGSGPERRETSAFLADRLARCGIAALIYDKRGVGASTGSWERARFVDLADDAVSAVAWLRRQRSIDGDRIGLIGTSEGAWVAPLAATRDGRIAFLVLVSGGGVTPAEHELYDDVVRLGNGGFTRSEVETATDLQRRLNDYLRTGAGYDAMVNALTVARDAPWFEYTELPREPPPPAAISSSWWRRHMDYDPIPFIERLDLPTFALFGATDDLVPVEESASRLRRAVSRSGHSASTVVVLAGGDHSLLQWGSERAPWPSLVDGHPGALVRWVTRQTGASGSCIGASPTDVRQRTGAGPR